MRVLKKELWPYKITVNPENSNDTTPVELWLGNKFGTFKGRWNIVHHWDHTDFYFRDQSDAVMFSLRWA